jgi:maltose O-acetyltransferase
MLFDWNFRRRARRAIRELRIVPRQVLLSIARLNVVTPSLRGSLYRMLDLAVSKDSTIQGGLYVVGTHLTIGRGTTINYQCTIDCRAEVRIGARCGIAFGVSLITASHEWDDPQRRAGAETYAPIRIGDGVWIGSNAVVLPGVSIGDGCVIGAGAVVTKDCEPNGFYAGVPARLVRQLPVSKSEVGDE